MSNIYSLLSGSAILVSVTGSSNLDGAGKKSTRRGSFIRTLAGTAVQYLETAVIGEAPLEWSLPRADGVQRAILQSASNGTYGDELVWRTPKYGDINVAFLPGREGYEEEFLPPAFGYSITVRFARLS